MGECQHEFHISPAHIMGHCIKLQLILF